MNAIALRTIVVLGVLSSGACVLPAQASKARTCPVGAIDTSRWAITRDPDLGIDIQHPDDYEEKHWSNRSDTSGVVMLSLRRSALSTIDFNGFRSGAARPTWTCLLRTRSAILEVEIERSTAMLVGGRDTSLFIGRGHFTPYGKPRVYVEISSGDSASMLEQFAILRSIRFLNGR